MSGEEQGLDIGLLLWQPVRSAHCWSRSPAPLQQWFFPKHTQHTHTHAQKVDLCSVVVVCNATALTLVFISYRNTVNMKGLDQVAMSDCISQGAIHSLIWVDGCYCGDSGPHCVWSLTQHCDILLLRKLWGVVILIHNVDVDGGGSLWGARENFHSCVDCLLYQTLLTCRIWYYVIPIQRTVPAGLTSTVSLYLILLSIHHCNTEKDPSVIYHQTRIMTANKNHTAPFVISQ